MLKLWGTFLFSLFLIVKGSGQSHGLQFSSHEVVPEKRTALNITPGNPLCFTKTTEIQFDFKFRPNFETYFGYVVRIIAGKGNKNVDIVYNQILRNFNFVVGEDSRVFELDSAKLHGNWNTINIRFDKEAKQATLLINGQMRSQQTLNPDQLCFKILFGINDSEGYQTVDLPPMQIRNIRITEDGVLKHKFPLAESTGNVAADSMTRSIATVRNPTWIKPKHHHWDLLTSFTTAGAASVAYNETKELLHIVSLDSLYDLSLQTGLLSGIPLPASRVMLQPGNQSVYDSRSQKLINFFIDEKKISVFNEQTKQWSQNFSLESLTEYWQSNKFTSPYDSSLYIVGGYGQLRYKNTIFRYHFPSEQWDTIKPAGDFFTPRYLSALGLNAAKDTAYILGGYGSNTGDQKINPRHNYELLSYSIKSKTIKKLQQLPEPLKHFAFANSLVIDSATRTYYSLVYARDRFNSSLQLLKGFLDSSAYHLVGDTIPYAFHDIESFADLFYSPALKKLVAVTLFTDKANVSTVKIYTLNFPPNELNVVTTVAAEKKQSWLLLSLAGLLILCVAAFLLLRKKRKNRYSGPGKSTVSPNIPAATTAESAYSTDHVTEPAMPRERETGPAIFLFGQFHVTDVNGNDITKQFTPLLKELFLLILINSFLENRGISSEALTEILWQSKSEKDAKNNRSVNIAKLKAALEKLGTPVITKESGLWQFQINDESVYVDFLVFNNLLQLPAQTDRAYISKLLHVVRRGTFLLQTDYTWLDDIKSFVSNSVIDRLIDYLEKSNVHDEAEFVIEICNAIFHFDRLNEQALEYKCKSLIILKRHALANTTYRNFTREYREIYQGDFGRSFNEIIR